MLNFGKYNFPGGDHSGGSIYKNGKYVEAYVCSSVSSFSKSDRDSVRKSWGQRYGAKATSGVLRPQRSPLCRDDTASICACAVAKAFLLLPLLLRARLASYPRTHKTRVSQEASIFRRPRLSLLPGPNAHTKMLACLQVAPQPEPLACIAAAISPPRLLSHACRLRQTKDEQHLATNHNIASDHEA